MHMDLYNIKQCLTEREFQCSDNTSTIYKAVISTTPYKYEIEG